MAKAKKNNYVNVEEEQKLDYEIKNLFKDISKKFLVNDGFINNVLNQGSGTSDPTNDTYYNSDRTKTWDIKRIESVERGEPLLKKVLKFKSSAPLKNGIDINSSEMTPEQIKYIQDELKLLYKDLYNLIYQSECFGGGASLICIRGQMTESELVKPLNIDRIQVDSFLGLKYLERWYSCIPDTTKLIDKVGVNGIDNPNLLGLPMYYKVKLLPNSKELKVHRSRLLFYNTGILSNVERIVEQYWGISILEELWDALVEYNSAFKYAINMLMISNQRVIYIDQFTDSENSTLMAKKAIKFKLELMKQSLNYSNILFLSNEDKFEYFSANMANTDKVLQKAALNFATKACVPYSALFDDSSLDYLTTENSYKEIQNTQELYIRDWYKLLIKIIWKNKYGGKVPQFTFEFKKIKDLNEKEKAEIIQKVSEQLIKLFENSVIDKETLIKSLGEITSNVGDVFNNFDSSFIKEHGKEMKINDQINLAVALNKNQDSNLRESFGGQTNETKPTPRPKINE